SANPFTGISPTTADHVTRGLVDRIDLVLDGGPTGVGIESTVVDLSSPNPVLLRPGSISRQQLRETLGREILLPGVYTGSTARPAPGMIPRHYSPTATLYLFPNGDSARFNTLVRDAVGPGERAAAVVRSPFVAPIERLVRMPAKAVDYARSLYAVLHELDQEG